LPSTSGAPGRENAERAASLIARTKTTSTTYARYAWSRITPPDRPPVEEWAAEFNDGPLHRVETPRDRLIANCFEKSGTAYSVATTKTFSGPGVAGIACGIDSTRPVISIRYIGPVVDPAGEADRVEVTDPERIRTYDITSDGIIIRTIIALNTPGKPVVLDEETQALMRQLPTGNLFDAASLDASVVPDAYKRPPVRR
jgi:hypothetical protein